MRVNWGVGGNSGRAAGVSNSATAACDTNNNSSNHRSDGSSGDRERAIPVAFMAIMAAAAALSVRISRSRPRPRGREGWTLSRPCNADGTPTDNHSNKTHHHRGGRKNNSHYQRGDSSIKASIRRLSKKIQW